jgi:hypothetical protein
MRIAGRVHIPEGVVRTMEAFEGRCPCLHYAGSCPETAALAIKSTGAADLRAIYSKPSLKKSFREMSSAFVILTNEVKRMSCPFS